MNTTLIKVLSGYLKDRDVLNLLSTCREFAEMRKHVQFTGHCRYDKWISLGIQVKNIYVRCQIHEIPIGATHVHILRGDAPFCKTYRIGEGATHVSFCNDFNNPVTFGESVTHIQFGKKFNQPVTLPPRLEQVRFGYYFNQPITLPNTMKRVDFGKKFNQPLVLPNGMKHVQFGDQFRQPITLPMSLVYAWFGKNFDGPINNYLPNLKFLYVGSTFTGPVNFTEMENLKHFESRSYYYQLPTDGLPDLEYLKMRLLILTNTVLPDTLKYLDASFDGPINRLPPNLEYFHQHFPSTPLIPGLFPKTLKHLDVYNINITVLEPGIIPDGVEHLKLELRARCRIVPGALPNSIKYLKLTHVGLEPGSIPDGVEELTIYNYYTDIVEGLLPDSIRVLNLEAVNVTIHSLPKRLLSLSLGNAFNMRIDCGIFPETLKDINFGERFNQPLTWLPDKMNTVIFGVNFNQPIPENFTARQITLNVAYEFEYIMGALRKRFRKIIIDHEICTHPVSPEHYPWEYTARIIHQ